MSSKVKKTLNDSNVYTAVNNYMISLGAFYHYGSQVVSIEDKEYTQADLQNLVTLRLKKHTQYEKKAAIALWWKTQEENVRDELLAQMLASKEHNPESDNMLRKWIDAVCVEGNELSYIVVKHWLWQAKRKMANLPVTDAMCLVLCGKTGGGKSTAVQMLLGPLNPFHTNLTSKQLTDERNWQEFRRNYAILLDDVQSFDTQQMDLVKSLITQERLKQRVMQTTTMSTLKVNSSLIATSNRNVAEVFKDPTSARRYWEIRCKDQLDWNELNAIDYPLLWTCVGAEDADPLLIARNEINKLQHEKLRYKSNVEEFCGDLGLNPGNVEVSAAYMYSVFRAWCTRSGIRVIPTIQKFGREMKTLGYNNVKKGTMFWLLNRKLELPEEDFETNGVVQLKPKRAGK